MKRNYTWTGLAGCLGLLAAQGCGSVCGDDGFVWNQAENPACLGASNTMVGTESGTGTESESATETVGTESATDPTMGGGGMWCADKDMDGFGDPNECMGSEFPGSVPNNDDCADDNSMAFPGAAEKDSADACMEDADEDGYGDDDPPPGVMPGSDCNDDDSSIFPDAAPNDLPGMCAQDSDGDGFGDSTPTDPDVPMGTDCVDDDPNTFPGAAPNDSPDACMTDADGDDWGDSTPSAPEAEAGTDCDDSSATTFPGAAQNEDMQCKKDDDDDGWGDDTPPNAEVIPGLDCDDSNANAGPGVAENEVDPNGCYQDDDGDGWGDSMPDDPDTTPGGDCEDSDPNTFPGAAPNDSAEACMTDADGDDWGDFDPNPGVDAGTDCADDDVNVHVDCVDCTPDEVKCVDKDLVTCNAQGNAQMVENCAAGCDDVGLKCWDPLMVDAGDSVCADPNMPVQLNAMTSGGDGMYNWNWTPAMGLNNAMIQNPTAMPAGPTTYTVDVTDGEGNMASDNVTVYLKNQTLALDPNICTTYDFTGTGETDPNTMWVWNNNTKELCQTINGKGSALFCGWELNNAKITGTFSVKTADDDDWTGFMWGIQDTDHFYIFTWKQAAQNFANCGGMVPVGMQVKVVNVADPMAMPQTCADRHQPADTPNSKLLVPVDQFYAMGWQDNTEYLFEITHKSDGEITIVIRVKANMQVVAMKTFNDTTYLSGKFGMYTKSQISACFSNFTADCL